MADHSPGHPGVIMSVILLCERCGTPLSTPVRRVPPPLARVRPSTRRWFARRIPYGCYVADTHAYLLSPSNVENTLLLNGRGSGRCCGTAGLNRICRGCGKLVASLVDDCCDWQEIAFLRDMVTVVPGPPEDAAVESPAPGVAFGDWTATALSTSTDETSWFVHQELATLALNVFHWADPGRTFLAEGPAEFLRDHWHSRNHRPRNEDGIGRMPAVRDATRWRAAAARAGLTPEILVSTITIVDVAGRSAPFSRGLALFHDWCAEEGVPLDGLRVLGIVPGEVEPGSGWWEWDHRTEWVGDLPPSAVHTVTLDAVLWSTLVTDPADTTRCFAGTRWGHPGLAELIHDDEGPHCPHELDDLAFSRRHTFRHG